jgi:hypothetical protein
VALSDERGAGVAVRGREVDEGGTVAGSAVEECAETVTSVEFSVGESGLILMFREKKRINKRIATINLKRS